MAGKLILPASYYAQVAAAEGRERRPAEGPAERPAERPRPGRPAQELQLLIKPVSGRCNLRCDYCFYRRVQEKLYPGARVMSGEVLEEMIRQFLGMRLRQTSFSWQGGEPTLAGLDFFREAVRLMMKHGRGGQSVGNAFQTNGVLLDDEWADFLAKYRFLVGVSVDGPPEIHDRYRGSSHAKALRGARTAVKLGVQVNILSCVSRANEGRARECYDFFKGEGFRHVQYIPVVEYSVGASGSAPGQESGEHRVADFSVRPEAYGEFLIELFDVWKADPDPACIRLFDGLIELAGTGRSPFCILAPACASYIVVEATGDLYPCDFFVREELRIGNLLDVPIPDARATEVAKSFSKIKLRRPGKCMSCEWWKVCRGGCLKEREAAPPTGDEAAFDRPGYLCEGTRRFLDHSWKHFERLGKRHFGRHGRPQSSQSPQRVQKSPAPAEAPSAVASEAPGPKARPNDPCPCGSGKKYKRCCARR